MQKIPMTTDGHKKLKAELKHLKSVERPSIIEQIAEASSMEREYVTASIRDLKMPRQASVRDLDPSVTFRNMTDVLMERGVEPDGFDPEAMLAAKIQQRTAKIAVIGQGSKTPGERINEARAIDVLSPPLDSRSVIDSGTCGDSASRTASASSKRPSEA